MCKGLSREREKEAASFGIGGCPAPPHRSPSAPGERPLRNSGLGAQKSPHRFRPGTAESFGKLRTGSASRLGEGKNRRPWTKRCPRAVVVRGASTGRPLTPTLSLKGEGGRGGSVWVRRLRGRPLTLALSRGRDLCLTGGGCPEDAQPNPLPRGEGARAAAASRTPGVYKSLRRRRAGVPVRVAGDVARLLGPAATLTPTLSLKGEGERGVSPRRSWLRTQVLAAEGREQRRRRSSGEGSWGA